MSLAGTAAADDSFYPNDPYFFYSTDRPGFPGQWHLENNVPSEGIDVDLGRYGVHHSPHAGLDANLRGAWNSGYTGHGVVIGIVDDGVQPDHPDLAPNLRPELSRHFSSDPALADLPQGPKRLNENHGTAVAGVAAARGGNGIGGTGAAPYAGIAGLSFDMFDEGDPLSPAIYWKSGVDPNSGTILEAPAIRVKNYSLGEYPFRWDTAAKAWVEAMGATGINGVIHVSGANNGRGTDMENSNINVFAISPYTIATGAMDSMGQYSYYSSSGANLFVTAPSGSSLTRLMITTTDRTGPDQGYNLTSPATPEADTFDTFPDPDYTNTFTGTSSSAPLVSGIMALGAEANPTMDVRMAKHALTLTSIRIDPDRPTWLQNGSGLHFSPDYGFGLIDAGAFTDTVSRAGYITQESIHTTGPTDVVHASGSGPGLIPDNNPHGLTQRFSLSRAHLNHPLEAVQVRLNLTHSALGHLIASIRSPAGTESTLLYHTPSGYDTPFVSDDGHIDWTFLSNTFWGEDGVGDWSLTVADQSETDTGTWHSYEVTLHMGEMRLLETGQTWLDHDVNARSLSLMRSGANLGIPQGRSLTVTHDVLVDGGVLTVDGHLGESGAPGARVMLNRGEITGNGRITASRGMYNLGGVLSVGESSSPLSIEGNYTQMPSGRLRIAVAPDRPDASLQVTGTATIGGTLEPIPGQGYLPTRGDRFTLVQADTITGSFDRILNLSPFLVLAPEQEASAFRAQAVRDYTNPALMSGLTVNQAATAMALNQRAETAAGDLESVMGALDSLTEFEAAARALDAMTVKIHSVLDRAALSITDIHADTLSQRLNRLRTARETAGNSFINVNSMAVRQDQSNEVPGFDTHTRAVTLGYDVSPSPDWIIGGFAGLHNIHADMHDTRSGYESKGGTIGLYAALNADTFFLNSALSLGIDRPEVYREIRFADLDREATSRPDSRLVMFQTRVGTAARWQGW
ncbi:MAG: S8 family serine peptidase, partial [Spirochaetes bacterium]|nr:S8 family serine peptidase [Spirochaetota bacterium]